MGIRGTTGCDIVVFRWIIVGKIVGKFGRVGDGNGVDGMGDFSLKTSGVGREG